MKSNFIALLVSLLVLVPFSGANAKIKYTSEFQVIDPDLKVLHQLEQTYPELIVDHVSAIGYELYGPEGLAAVLDQYHVQYAPLSDDKDLKILASYPSPEQIIDKMNALQSKYPKLVKLIEIGKSVQGRPLMFAKITSKQNDSSLPEFKYVANMHGDEIVGREMMIRFMEDLLSLYGQDARITKLLDSVQIFIMPSMNPDGAKAMRRMNANDADLNRDFPEASNNDPNSTQNKEPEVVAMMNFQAAHKFKLSANFHGGTAIVNYPWDGRKELFPYDDLVKKISLEYAKPIPRMYNNHGDSLRPSPSFIQGTTNGYAWYPVYGGMQDWSYVHYQDLQVTIELFKEKWPGDYSMIETIYKENKNSLIRYIEQISQI